MHKATFAFLLLFCVGSSAGLYLALTPSTYHPGIVAPACADISLSCYPPVVRRLLP